jgi:hypothetical protein
LESESKLSLLTRKRQEKTPNGGAGISGRTSVQLQRITRGANQIYRFVTLFWPKKVKAAKLEEIHSKMMMKEANTTPNAAPVKKAKANGSASKANGKAPR